MMVWTTREQPPSTHCGVESEFEILAKSLLPKAFAARRKVAENRGCSAAVDMIQMNTYCQRASAVPPP